MEVDDQGLFFISEVASLDVRPQVIDPPQSATLATPVEACFLGQVTPSPEPFLLYVLAQPRIFLGAPRPFLQPLRLVVVAGAARSSHFCSRKSGSTKGSEPKDKSAAAAGLWIEESIRDLETSEVRPLAFINCMASVSQTARGPHLTSDVDIYLFFIFVTYPKRNYFLAFPKKGSIEQGNMNVRFSREFLGCPCQEES